MELSKRKTQGLGVYEHSISSESTPKDVGSAPPSVGSEFKYGGLLLWSLIPSLFIIAGFGAKPTLIAACFGGLIVYILDLLGTIEVRDVSLDSLRVHVCDRAI